jgi:hypothetical protein
VPTFADYLRSTSLVLPARIPEYEGWAARFDAWQKAQKGDSQTAELATRKRFLSAFADNTPEWMLSRAERAIRIYIDFLRRSNLPVPDMAAQWSQPSSTTIDDRGCCITSCGRSAADKVSTSA